MLRVNGESISEEAIKLEFNRLTAFYKEHKPQADLSELRPVLMRKAREQAIGAVLLMHEARRREITVLPEKVDAKFRDMIDTCGGKNAFMQMVSRKSLDLDTLRDAIAGGLQVDELVRSITADVSKPAENEIQEYYDDNRAAFVTPEKIRARHILLKYDDSKPAERAVAETRLKGFSEEIEKGADFTELAKIHSECPSGRQAGGMIGWIGRGTILPAIEQAVFALTENGELSDPVETPLGMHLFQRLDHKPSQQATYEEARHRVAELLQHARRGERLRAFVAQLQQDAIIEDDETTPDTDDDDDPGFDFDDN